MGDIGGTIGIYHVRRIQLPLRKTNRKLASLAAGSRSPAGPIEALGFRKTRPKLKLYPEQPRAAMQGRLASADRDGFDAGGPLRFLFLFPGARLRA
jgi:hypothetical protein